VERTGGVSNPATSDEALAEAMTRPTDASGQEALRAVDELRNELASAKGDLRAALARIEDLESQVASSPAYDLRSRVEQIEDRLQ
jgi:polyhydroxyalkanoate synthesis regulator phasin